MSSCLLVLDPPDGGAAEHVLQLATGVHEHGWSAEVAGPPDSHVSARAKALGIAYHGIPITTSWSRPDVDVKAVRAIYRLLRRGRADVVHLHDARAGVVGRIAAWAAGVPAVYTPHCFPFLCVRPNHEKAVSIAIERSLRRPTNALICVSEFERRGALANRIVPPERTRVIHNGTPPCPDPTEPAAALERFGGGMPLAGCVTGLRPQKAVHHFIEAAPEILRRVPDARLAVVGNGPLRGELEQRARELGLPGRLEFFDFEAPAARYLRLLDVFVLPSLWESLPIAVLEALACGVPQVATDVGGTGEAVADGETGLLCRAADPPALADAVVRLLSDAELRRRMAVASRKRHEAQFRVEPMIRATVDVYESVLNMARR